MDNNSIYSAEDAVEVLMAAMSLKSPDTLAVAYSNYFETVSTVTNQLVNQTHFQVVIFAFNRLLLYYTWYNYVQHLVFRY